MASGAHAASASGVLEVPLRPCGADGRVRVAMVLTIRGGDDRPRDRCGGAWRFFCSVHCHGQQRPDPAGRGFGGADGPCWPTGPSPAVVRLPRRPGASLLALAPGSGSGWPKACRRTQPLRIGLEGLHRAATALGELLGPSRSKRRPTCECAVTSPLVAPRFAMRRWRSGQIAGYVEYSRHRPGPFGADRPPLPAPCRGWTGPSGV